MIAVIDYGLGNVKSVVGAIEWLGYTPCLTNSHRELADAEKLVLPGVGAFGDGMQRLRDLGLVETLTRLVLDERRPILGICLGLQLFARDSSEFGIHEGLGWIDASVVRIESGDGKLRIPHVGWSGALQIKASRLFHGIPSDAMFYYTHSYRLECRDRDIVVGECEYGRTFVSAIEKDNVYGTQFHPEKSQKHGLSVLRNFLDRA